MSRNRGWINLWANKDRNAGKQMRLPFRFLSYNAANSHDGHILQ